MRLHHRSILRRAPGCLAGFLFLLGATGAPLAWERPHSDGANTGYADATTKPAGAGSVSVPNIGSFATGAGPVVAPDGTVYIGNQEGELIALHADGTPYWRRSITPGQTIVASPAIGADGMVYVIGIEKYTDTSVSPPKQRTNSSLHRFTASGGWLGEAPFPTHGSRGAAGAAPNIWRYQGAEMIIVPAAYSHNLGGGHDVRLIAFSTGGAVLADTRVTSFVPTVTGGGLDFPAWRTYTCLIPPFVFCTLGAGFQARDYGPMLPPAPSVGIFTYAGGGTPFILVSDHLKDLVGYTFSGGAFIESFRVHDDKRFMRTAPVILPNAHSLIGYESATRDNDGNEFGSSSGGVIFSGPNLNKVSPIGGLYAIVATPTRMADGRVALVGDGQLAILDGTQVVAKIPFPGRSVVSAAASRGHVFLSTSDAFLSYDTNSLAEIARLDWVGGGLNPPAIGPKGQVYAIASNILFVFPPPRFDPQQGVAQPGMDLVAIDPAQPPPAQASSQLYHPPLTTSGNRLFACLELDGDDCGKGDYNEVSLAWCQKQGFAKVQGYDVDSRKVKAETLDGHFCSKNKCKVFDEIACKN